MGCFDYSDDEREEMWIFSSEAPECTYVSYNVTEDGSDCDDYDGDNE
jgi:hypothetical protein